MITNTTAKMTYTFTEGVTEYAVGFVYQTNPDGSPQIKVYINDAVNTPLVYGTDYTMSQDGTKVVIASGAEVGDSLTIIRNIPIVQLSDYVVGRIDPEQIENDFDLCVERDQQQSARITVTEEQLAAHDERISDIEDVIPEGATTDNLLATVSDIPTDLAELTNSPGYITGITSSDVTTALGYTPYDSSNPDGYTTNTGTVTSVNNVQPVNGNVTLEFPTAEQSDWSQSDNTKVDYIKNKPTLGTMAAENASDYTPTASLATVATTGDYDDLLDKPTIPTVNNTTITFTQGGETKGTITLNQASAATIAFDAGGGGGAVDSVNGYTGVVVLAASDVGALPDSTTIPDAQIQSDWDQSDNTKVDYIKNKPSIPAAQVNADWDAVSGVAQILNKPTIPAAQVNSDWDAASGVAQILNKPTIPTVNDSTITITQGGVTKGTFTTNQGSASTIALDAGGSSPTDSLFVNATVIGSPNINGSIVNGFTTTSYLETPIEFNFSNATSFEVGGSFTTASDISKTQYLTYRTTQNSRGLIISVSSTKMKVAILNSGLTSSFDGDTVLTANTKYWFKVTYNGTSYVLSLSTDGINYATDGSTQQSATPDTDMSYYMGYSYAAAGDSVAPVSELQMENWYAKKNGSIIWRGAVGHKIIAFQAPTSGNNYTWYRKYDDGWVEQGGYVDTTDATYTATFPVEMADTNYTIQVSSRADRYAIVSPNTALTTTGVTGWIADSRNGRVYWEVKGMAA